MTWKPDFSATAFKHRNATKFPAACSAIRTVIDCAVKSGRYYEGLGHRGAVLSDLIRSGEPDVLIFTAEGQELFSSAEQIPSETREFLREKIPNVLEQGVVKMIRHSHGDILSIQGKSLRSGGENFCVYKISWQSNIAMTDKYRIQYLSATSDLSDCNPMEYYLGGTETSCALQSACKRYAAR